MKPLKDCTDVLKSFINTQFANKEPWQIVTITSTSLLTGIWLWGFIFQAESVHSRVKKFIFRTARKIPFVAKKISEEMDHISEAFEKDVIERGKKIPFLQELQQKGMEENEIIQTLNNYLQLGHYDWKEGYVSGTVYYYSDELIKILTKVYSAASYTNPLHADVFPGVCKMEAEVVRISANLFHGGPESCGTMTTGGTESILMACKAYRDYGREEKGIKEPNMVIPRTAHPAFEKAANYLGITIRYVNVDPSTTSVLVNEMKKKINGNTIMLVGSVPNYPYGTKDDIVKISELGLRYGVPVHVDCCLGGFLTVFMPEAGISIEPFDFSLPGVTSISADTHKYGFAPKGSSVVLYSHPKYRHHQYCVTTDWPGGIYGSPTVNGSRAGGIIAACWATMMYFGKDGYVKATKKIIETTKYIENRLRKIESIYIFGKPITSVIAIGSHDFHIFRLVEVLNKKGWSVNPLQFPPGLHICVTHIHTQDGVADRFVSDIEDALIEILKNPELAVEGDMAVYGMSQGIPDRSIVGEFTKLFIDSMYFTPKQEEKAVMNGVH